MSMFERRRRAVPGLNTASLPDLIFTVLFFFIIVTHLRDTDVGVECEVPQGTELTEVKRRAAVCHVYIGRPAGVAPQSAADTTRIQVNGKFVSAGQLGEVVAAMRDGMAADDAAEMKVCVHADKRTEFGVVSDVKQALRQAGIADIVFVADDPAGEALPAEQQRGR